MNGARGMNANYSPVQQFPSQGLFNSQSLGLLMNAIKGSQSQPGQGTMTGYSEGGMEQPTQNFQLGQPLVGQNPQPSQPSYVGSDPFNQSQLPSPLLAALMRQKQPGAY